MVEKLDEKLEVRQVNDEGEKLDISTDSLSFMKDEDTKFEREDINEETPMKLRQVDDEGDTLIEKLSSSESIMKNEKSPENINNFKSKDEITNFAEDFSFKALSNLSSGNSENDSNLLDIFLKALVASEQVEIANTKYEIEHQSYEEARSNSKRLWTIVEEKAQNVSNVIQVSKKNIGEAIKNMEAQENQRTNIEKEMKLKEQRVYEDKEKSESELRRAEEMMALSEIHLEAATEALEKAIAQKKKAKEEIFESRKIVEEKKCQFKIKKKILRETEKYAKEEIEKADKYVKYSIDASYELEVKAASDIKAAKKEKDIMEKNGVEYDTVVQKEELKMLVAESVYKRALGYRKSIASEAHEAQMKLTVSKANKDKEIEISEEKKSHEKVEVEVNSTSSKSSNVDSSDLGENEAKNNLRARLNLLKSMNPANE